MKGLIGYNGFVGSNILKHMDFDLLYNSRNILEIHDQEFKLLICAGAPGSMTEANRNKDSDKENIHLLIDSICRSKPDRLILISTIGIFKDFSACNDENSDAYEMELAYGVNRRHLEQSIKSIFPKTQIIRLPALFGDGLNKNFIFDLLNQAPSFFTVKKFMELKSNIDQKDKGVLQFYAHNANSGLYILDRDRFNCSAAKINVIRILNDIKYSSLFFHSHLSTYQFYNLDNLWADICIVMENEINIMHLTSEPISTNEIYRKIFSKDMPSSQATIHDENMITNYSHIWKSNKPYIQNKHEILHQLHNFYLKKSNS